MTRTDTQRDLVFSLAILVVVGAPILYFDARLYPTNILDHLPDHILALVAIVGASLAIRYERKLDNDFERQKSELSTSFEEQKTRIEKIVLAIYTQFLGKWPEHLRDITQLVKQATADDELLISVDLFGYGHFSVPDDYARYFRALEDARRSRVNIKLMVNPESAARECLHSQLDQQYKDTFEKLAPLLPAYKDKYPLLIETLPSSYEEFLTLALHVQSSLCRQLAGAITDVPVEVRTTISPSAAEAVFCWMIRKKGNPMQMIFAYPRYVGVGTGYGFQTHDLRLMEIFSGQFDAKWKLSNKVERETDLYPAASAAIRAAKQQPAGKSPMPAPNATKP